MNNLRSGAENPEHGEPQPFTRTEMLAVARIGGVFAVSVALYLGSRRSQPARRLSSARCLFSESGARWSSC